MSQVTVKSEQSGRRGGKPLGVILRSLGFLIALVLLSVVYSPLLATVLAPTKYLRAAFHSYLRMGLRLMSIICGTSYVVRGRGQLPDGPVLYASKHQSGWDSVVLPMLLGDPLAIAKRELLFLPVIGWVAWGMDHVFIDRRDGARSLIKLLPQIKRRVNEGRSVLIFPEGTRKSAAPYEVPDYKAGVAALYQTLRLPCVPVALNSGLFWPTGSLLRYPGTIEVECLQPVPAGLDRQEFLDTLVNRIESNSRRLAGAVTASGLQANTSSV